MNLTLYWNSPSGLRYTPEDNCIYFIPGYWWHLNLYPNPCACTQTFTRINLTTLAVSQQAFTLTPLQMYGDLTNSGFGEFVIFGRALALSKSVLPPLMPPTALEDISNIIGQPPGYLYEGYAAVTPATEYINAYASSEELTGEIARGSSWDTVSDVQGQLAAVHSGTPSASSLTTPIMIANAQWQSAVPAGSTWGFVQNPIDQHGVVVDPAAEIDHWLGTFVFLYVQAIEYGDGTVVPFTGCSVWNVTYGTPQAPVITPASAVDIPYNPAVDRGAGAGIDYPGVLVICEFSDSSDAAVDDSFTTLMMNAMYGPTAMYQGFGPFSHIRPRQGDAARNHGLL